MKVKELIARLKDHPEDMEVCVYDDEYDYFSPELTIRTKSETSDLMRKDQIYIVTETWENV